MPHFLVISSHPDDVKLGKQICLINGFQYHQAVIAGEVRQILKAINDLMVFWNADEFSAESAIPELLSRYTPPSRNAAVSSEPFGVYPHLLGYPFFGQQIQRRYANPAYKFYAKLAAANLQTKVSGLRPFFDERTAIQRLEIKRSSHKQAAIEALQKVLTKRGIGDRIAKTVAQSTDELLLNAIFDAPITPDQVRFRHRDSRAIEFERTGGERVYVELGASSDYVGINVTDSYGSLSRLNVFKSLRSYFQKEAKLGDMLSAPSSGFGLHGIIQSGASLRILCHTGQRTEAMIFIPVVGSVREFKKGFRFFSLIVAK